MDNFIKTLGENIRNARKSRGLSQQKLGEASGLDYRYIGFIEQARVNPTIKTLEKVAFALNLSLKELFPKKSEAEIAKKMPDSKALEREKILDDMMRHLKKADMETLKNLEQIIKISAKSKK
jgi:transcriptional regulator with XRE-family HTH domain